MNFAQFMVFLNALLPTIGSTVEALHPNDAPEATKINAGISLFNAVSQAALTAVNQSQAPAGTAPTV